MASEVIVRQGVVPDAVADMNARLPPNQLPQWSRVSKLDKSRYPKPFLKDRLNPLPPTRDGVKFSDTVEIESDDSSLENNPVDMNPSQRIQHLEKSIHFLRQQHFEILSSLHEEIEALKKDNKGGYNDTVVHVFQGRSSNCIMCMNEGAPWHFNFTLKFTGNFKEVFEIPKFHGKFKVCSQTNMKTGHIC
jgi:hypothetical protein